MGKVKRGGKQVIKHTARRILIIEDEVLVAMYLEELLTEMGHQVVGPAVRINDAMELAREAAFDFAVLDVNLAGVPSFPVADILRQRGIPFVFVTGYGAGGLVDGYRNELALQKPFDSKEIERTITEACRSLV
jgi:DNA-binding response OmpR family regulator